MEHWINGGKFTQVFYKHLWEQWVQYRTLGSIYIELWIYEIIKIGIRNHSEFGQLTAYENKTKLSFHRHNYCNAINGSDGTLNPPFIEPGVTDVYFFVPELCRSIKWQYDHETVTHGIPVSRFKFPDILTPYENPDLWCFCPYHKLEKCDIHGMATLAACYQGKLFKRL